MKHTPYAVARFDGALIYESISAGFIITGLTKSPVVNFKVKTGVQLHPVWALDDLAIEVFSYCQAAKEVSVSETHLQVSVVASWLSANNFSNLVAADIEWHIASSNLRTKAEKRRVQIQKDKIGLWPTDELALPVQLAVGT